jgi:hypothetical protein
MSDGELDGGRSVVGVGKREGGGGAGDDCRAAFLVRPVFKPETRRRKDKSEGGKVKLCDESGRDVTSKIPQWLFGGVGPQTLARPVGVCREAAVCTGSSTTDGSFRHSHLRFYISLQPYSALAFTATEGGK